MSRKPISGRRDGARAKESWMVDPRIADRLLWGLGIACAALLIADPLVHKHGPFAVAHWVGFYGITGFAVCAAAILLARLAGGFLKRGEDYYDD